MLNKGECRNKEVTVDALRSGNKEKQRKADRKAFKSQQTGGGRMRMNSLICVSSFCDCWLMFAKTSDVYVIM